MAAKELAVQGCTLEIQTPVSGNASITSSPSTKVKADNKGVYKGTVLVSVSGASQGNCQGASGVGSFTTTAQKCKVENETPLRKDDEATVTCNGTDPTQGGAPCSFSATVKVSDAGQNKVKGA
jgi:hypothetical protein